MSELSNIVLYFLSTVSSVFATILGFFIVGQIYIKGLIQKSREKNEAMPRKTSSKGFTDIVVIKEVKYIYRLLIGIILLSFMGILLNTCDSILGKGILIIPIIVMALAIYVMKELYDYISTWFGDFL